MMKVYFKIPIVKLKKRGEERRGKERRDNENIYFVLVFFCGTESIVK